MFKNYPAGFKSLFWTESCLNFSFYGLKSIFVLYAIARFQLPESDAIGLFATLMTLSYGLSVFGGWIADRFLGTKDSILLGAGLVALGLCLLLSPLYEICLLSLALIGMGSGFYKPNLSAAPGILYKNPEDPQKDKAYSTLYIAMNLGSFAGPLISGYLYTIGFEIFSLYVFVILICGLSLVVGWRQEKVRTNSNRWVVLGCLPLLTGTLYILIKYHNSLFHLMGIIALGSFVYLGRIYSKSSPKDRRSILQVFLYILLFSLFCTLFEQAGSSILLFINKVVDRQLFGFYIPSSAFLSIEPIFVVMLSPLLLLYLKEKKEGLHQMMLGFGFTGLSFFILGLGCLFSTEQVAGAWMLGSIMCQALGELLIVPIVFASVSKFSPQGIRGVMMSFCLMAIAYGHLMGGFLAGFSVHEGGSLTHYSQFFLSTSFFPWVIAAVVGIFYFSRGLKKRGMPKKQYRVLNKIC